MFFLMNHGFADSGMALVWMPSEHRLKCIKRGRQAMQTQEKGFDVGRRYVREIERRPDGLVEFEFAIGEPDLFVEMLLPFEHYAAFCNAQGAVVLAPRETDGEGAAADDWSWRMRDATHQRFR